MGEEHLELVRQGGIAYTQEDSQTERSGSVIPSASSSCELRVRH